jgi:polar amino acid transport system substrate-binding protein
MVKNLITISTLAILLLSAPTARAETITIVADEWCPYNCTPGSDKPGVFIEIAKKAFEPLGITVNYKIVPWARAIEGTREGKYTAVTGASHGDAEDFIFPEEPQSKSIMTFYVRPENTWQYNGVDSLANISLGTIGDYSYGEGLDEYIKKYPDDMRHIQEVGGDTALKTNVKKLLKRRIDATIESENVMAYYLAQNGLVGQLKDAGHLPLTDDQSLFIAFSPKLPESKKYAKILSDTTKALRASGQLNEILAKYNLSEETPVSTQPLATDQTAPSTQTESPAP